MSLVVDRPADMPRLGPVFRSWPSTAGLAVAAALGLCAVELTLILMRLGGHFSYSLDDPYIHLALADQIAQGHYGLNVGEAAAPSSSIVFPVLLAGMRGLGLGQFASLTICIAATLASSLLLVRLLEASLPSPALTKPVGAVLATSLILSLNLIGLAFTGMEHSLHVAVTLACLLGLIRFLETGHLAPWCWVCALAEPLIRYEGATLWLGIVVLLLSRRRWAAGLSLLAVGAAALVLFSAMLLSQGLPPLPSSVLVKSYVAAGGLSASVVASLRETLSRNMASFGMVRLVALCGMLTATVFGRPQLADQRPNVRPLAALALAVGCAHVLLGRFGWFSRYEIYAIAFDLMVLVYAFGPVLGRWLDAATPPRVLIAALCPIAFLSTYAKTTAVTALAASDIYEQQYQMHRFVADVYRRPVGVNDLGWVSYGSPSYVLDFWGLGSEAARKLRLSDPSGRWMDDLARRHDVGLAMIYATWFDRVPETWQVVAQLRPTSQRVAIGDDIVTFYATTAAARDDIEAALRIFAPTLPAGARLTLEPRH